MIEALAILVVVAAVLAIYVFDFFQAQEIRSDPAGEMKRLRESLVWLEERRRLAEEHNYDPELRARIAEQTASAQARLAELAAQPHSSRVPFSS